MFIQHAEIQEDIVWRKYYGFKSFLESIFEKKYNIFFWQVTTLLNVSFYTKFTRLM